MIDSIVCCLLIAIFGAIILRGSIKDGEVGGVAGGVTLLMCSLLFLALSEYLYKNGQVDALTGKVKYELVTNADSTKTWEQKK